MTLIKMIAASVAGALMFSSGALARSKTNESHSQCTAVAVGYSEGKNQELTAYAAAGAAKYLCDDYGDPYAIAESTASAFAEAVAYAAASCVLIGDATANAHASANAKAQAEIWVTSYFDAWASASDCKKCDAYASSWGYIQKYVFLEAVANAEVKLNLATSKDLKVIVKSVADYKYDIERVVVTAYAQALADANKYRKSSNCVAWVNAGGCIWTEGTDDEKYYCAGCSAVAYSEGSVSKIDAIATAAASAAAWTCGNSVAIADVEVTAQALAKAVAKALSIAYASCWSNTDDAYACAYAYTEIEVWVKAVVKAWATAWAGAYNCKDTCDVNVDIVVEAVTKIIAKASTDAYAAVCQWGAGSWTEFDLEQEISKKSLCAVAEAAVLAISSPDGCLAAGIAYAGTGTCQPH